jgi:hypothetical protein
VEFCEKTTISPRSEAGLPIAMFTRLMNSEEKFQKVLAVGGGLAIVATLLLSPFLEFEIGSPYVGSVIAALGLPAVLMLWLPIKEQPRGVAVPYLFALSQFAGAAFWTQTWFFLIPLFCGCIVPFAFVMEADADGSDRSRPHRRWWLGLRLTSTFLMPMWILLGFFFLSESVSMTWFLEFDIRGNFLLAGLAAVFVFPIVSQTAFRPCRYSTLTNDIEARRALTETAWIQGTLLFVLGTFWLLAGPDLDEPYRFASSISFAGRYFGLAAMLHAVFLLGIASRPLRWTDGPHLPEARVLERI